MIPVKKVQILWSENARVEALPTKEFPTLQDASYAIAACAHTAPKSGYNKTAFRVTWQDDGVYEGRYDLHHISQNQENPSGDVDLGDHIIAQLEFQAGRRQPPHLSKEVYESLLTPENIKEARIMLDTYQIHRRYEKCNIGENQGKTMPNIQTGVKPDDNEKVFARVIITILCPTDIPVDKMLDTYEKMGMGFQLNKATREMLKSEPVFEGCRVIAET